MAYKILIVDDEKMLTELLSSHLQDCGYETFVAEDAEQAISMLNIYPDLILLDINMPEMDGLVLCKIIRNNVTCPILFLTARITEQDKVNGLQVGGDDYITKPFSLQELTARVAAHLRRDERSKHTPKIVSSQGLIVNLAERKIFYGRWDGI
ncbi:transcriptional regulatory protein WalR [Thomasclavelia cocleata]|uniref:Transcriptional regulatory protein WalR n=1 Tax=Thomasclavelia cocleata TaxID=69824 RepID=A0A829ZFN0_9FIRM|nr:response regulator transcription factor [Thomasclavelia cocleata]GFI41744.1 transcriptional regulatory protein WalR [Thomasclavelia cocleata]